MNAKPQTQTRSSHGDSATHAPSRRLRVAILGLYPRECTQVTGGVEAVVATLADQLARQPDLDVFVISGTPEVEHITREQRGPVTVYRVPEKRLGRLLLFRPDHWWLRRAIRIVQPDIVHAHGSGTYVDAALSTGRPAVVTVHGIVAEEARLAAAHGSFGDRLRWSFDARYERYCLRRARDVIAISPYLLRVFPWLAQRARVTQIENPVDASYFDIQRAPQPATILSPARIIARKGTIDLIRAFAEVQRTWPDAELRLAGEATAEPAYTDLCREEAARLGIEARVIFLGPLPRAAVQEELATCTAVALAAHQETAPVTIEEAMAAGCPVVATAVGGVPDLVEHERSGLLCEPGDVPGLAEQLNYALGEPLFARRLGITAQRIARSRFHPVIVAQQTRAVYEKLVAR